MKFEPIVDNLDLDVHLDPPGLWSRVAVVCRWKDAHAFRKRWPHAAVVGPLRTLRGLDEFVRNLLYNPQIRLVVLEGNDLTPDEETTASLLSVWNPTAVAAWEKYLSPDLHPHMRDLVWGCFLVRKTVKVYEEPTPFEALQAVADDPDATFAFLNGTTLVSNKDRPAGRITLPPPPPKAGAPAPHGDPGERVAADTLAELWPMVLHRAMRFGRIVPTQYGDTRELMDLVAVIRDPNRSIEDLPTVGTVQEAFGEAAAPKHPVLQIGMKQALAYHERVTGEFAPHGSPYSYGSRMHGTCSSCNGDRFVGTGDEQGTAPCSRCNNGNQDDSVDQFERLDQLLREKPDTRAAFVTPWRPEEDAGKESGRPCLVGAWFRAIPGAKVKAAVAPGNDDPETRFYASMIGREMEIELPSTLHLTVAFRSHDLFGAYPTNLAGICLWHVQTARRHGMEVGSLTCVSMSAHLYKKDWNDADEKVSLYHDTNREPQWDQRSTWRVEVMVGPELPVKVGQTVTDPSAKAERWTVVEVLDNDHFMMENSGTKKRVRAAGGMIRSQRNDPARTKTLRATALTPDGRQVVKVLEATTVEALRGQVERSGLVTSVGGALWLGAEIERVGRGVG